MAFKTFTPPVAPSPGTTQKPEFKNLVADFGEGYTQGSPDGINSMKRVLSLTWETLLPVKAKVITDFLEGQLGVVPFLYTPSNETVARKWICSDWSDKRGKGGLRDITATFKETYAIAP